MFLQLFNIGMSDLSGLTYVGPNNAVVEGWVGGIRRGVFLKLFEGGRFDLLMIDPIILTVFFFYFHL